MGPPDILEHPWDLFPHRVVAHSDPFGHGTAELFPRQFIPEDRHIPLRGRHRLHVLAHRLGPGKIERQNAFTTGDAFDFRSRIDMQQLESNPALLWLGPDQIECLVEILLRFLRVTVDEEGVG